MKTKKKNLKQWNYCVSLLRTTKRKYYSRLDEKSITDNDKFWRTVKPVLWDKTPLNAKITLIEDGEIITSDNERADILNTSQSCWISRLKSLL